MLICYCEHYKIIITHSQVDFSGLIFILAQKLCKSAADVADGS